MDQYNKFHFLPMFLSKISSPDTSKIDFDKNDKVVDGIRTLTELAHFVRCFPMLKNEVPFMWATPDFQFTMKKGATEDHAILLASMFMGAKYEHKEDVEQVAYIAREAKPNEVKKLV